MKLSARVCFAVCVIVLCGVVAFANQAGSGLSDGDVVLEGSIASWRETVRSGVSVHILTLRIPDGRQQDIMLHDGLQQIPVYIDGVLIQPGTLSERTLRTKVVLLSSGLAVPVAAQLHLYSKKHIRIVSNPSGAEVHTNGGLAGNTPLDLHVWSGRFSAVVSKPGYLSNTIDSALANSVHEFDIVLKRRLRLSIASSASNTQVYQDGSFKGVAPLTLVLEGQDGTEFRFEGRKHGHLPDQREVRIDGEADRTIRFEMGEEDLRERVVSITSDPTPGADVFFLNEKIGQTPIILRLSGRTNGHVIVSYSRSGRAYASTNTFDLTESLRADIRINLDREPRYLRLAVSPKDADVQTSENVVSVRSSRSHLMLFGPNELFRGRVSKYGFFPKEFSLEAGTPGSTLHHAISLDRNWGVYRDEHEDRDRMEFFGLIHSLDTPRGTHDLPGGGLATVFDLDDYGIQFEIRFAYSQARADSSLFQNLNLSLLTFETGLRFNVVRFGPFMTYLRLGFLASSYGEDIGEVAEYWGGAGGYAGAGLRVILGRVALFAEFNRSVASYGWSSGSMPHGSLVFGLSIAFNKNHER